VTKARTCYVCKQYVYGRPRHAACEPRYRRIKIFPCEVCGRMARGRRHRQCEGFVPVGYTRCGYCFGVTRGAKYHNQCQPDHYEYAVFADMAEVVQRRCVVCREWFPFASIGPSDDDVNEAFAPRGKSTAGRPLYQGKCRACLSQERQERYERTGT
jgi:hypothetical protein